MDENNSAVETEVIDDTVFDEGWGDAPAGDKDMDLSEPEESAEPEDQRPAEDAEAQEQPEAVEEQTEEKPAEERKAEGRSWKLKHNGEDVDADEAKMIELAQKGLDYDRVREDRDRFKDEHPKYAEYEKFLNELAQSAGTDVAALMENVRASMLMQKAEKDGKPITQEAAVSQLRAEAAAAKAAEAQQAEAARKQANLRSFMAAYPNVKAEDVPLKVLQEGFESGDLAGAYARYENKQLKEELETLKQNKKNTERSAGSRRSSGNKTPKDDFDDAWDSF